MQHMHNRGGAAHHYTTLRTPYCIHHTLQYTLLLSPQFLRRLRRGMRLRHYSVHRLRTSVSLGDDLGKEVKARA